MEYVNPESVNTELLKELADAWQRRIVELENSLDDLVRSVEIAQISRQYQLTEPFVADAERLLADRLTMPEIEQGDLNLTVVEGEISEETQRAWQEAVAKEKEDRA